MKVLAFILVVLAVGFIERLVFDKMDGKKTFK